MTLGQIIKAYRIRNHLSQRQFALLCDVSNGYISMLEDERNPKTNEPIVPSLVTMKKIAKAMNMTLNDLMSQADDMEVSLSQDSSPDGDAIDLSKLNNVRRINPRRFPLLGKIACGQPILAVEEHDSYVTADRDIDADFCVIAKGDSMRQSRICDGDTVFIKRMQAVGDIRNVAAAGVVAIIINDEVTLKRVYYNKDNDTLILADDNSKRPPILLTGSEIDNLNCIGRAVCFMSLL